MSHEVCMTRNSGTALRRAIYAPQPIWCRVYNPALGKWLVTAPEGITAQLDVPTTGGKPGTVSIIPCSLVEGSEPCAGGLQLVWTHDRDAATVMESHTAEAVAEALVGISYKFGLGWREVYAERAGRRESGGEALWKLIAAIGGSFTAVVIAIQDPLAALAFAIIALGFWAMKGGAE